VIGAIKGTPPADQVITPADDLVNPFIDLVDIASDGSKYSYVFDGSAEVLDT